jgi:TPP-dependent pyruvate/acetoin dehydrogenase alpha subunit
VYRTAEEVRSWRERDPITRYGLLLGERGIASAADLDGIWQDVSAQVKDAIDKAVAAAAPGRDSLYEHLYGDPAHEEQFSRMQAGAPFGERGDEQTWQT